MDRIEKELEKKDALERGSKLLHAKSMFWMCAIKLQKLLETDTEVFTKEQFDLLIEQRNNCMEDANFSEGVALREIQKWDDKLSKRRNG